MKRKYMRKTMYKTIPLWVGLLSLTSCYDRLAQGPQATTTTTYRETYQKRERVFSLAETKTQEEGATRFVKFTDETEQILGPHISTEKGVIEWYAPGFISISPDGKRIAYLGRKDWQSNIYIKNTEGGKQTIQRTFRNVVLDMAFSRKGDFIAFTEKTDNDYNIYQINATEGMAVQQLTTTPNRETSPVYSHDDKMVYFTKSEKSAQGESYRHYIWSYDRNTALLTQYTEGFTPDLHPNGKIMALSRNNRETGRGEIWTVDLVSGQSTQIITHQEMGFSSPKFSPDGKYILLVGSTVASQYRRENLDIYVIKPDGSGLTQLTFHPGHDCSPIWAPDGKSIYFLSQRGSGDTPRFSVWQMDFNVKF